jgi:hypothetical protein
VILKTAWMIELTVYHRLPHACVATLVPAPIPSPVLETCELPIEVMERHDKMRALGERGTLSWKWSKHATPPMTRPCVMTTLHSYDMDATFSLFSFPLSLYPPFGLPILSCSLVLDSSIRP